MTHINAALDRAALAITSAVGTMWCALVFTALSLVSLPGVLTTGDLVQIVAWIAQTFLQLVLLSVIMVGQRLQAEATETLIRETHDIVAAEADTIRALIEELHRTK